MLRVGITGGIGSGKSTVCEVFAALGIPVFNADEAARFLMNHDAALMAQVRELLGDAAYNNGKLDSTTVSDIVYREPEKLQHLNAIVHPATIAYGTQWMSEQTSLYTIKEAAIFFESGSNADIDFMIGVFCPLDKRIERAMKRSNLSREKVLQIVGKQMDEDEKMQRCNAVITNDDIAAVLPQVLALHERLLGKAA